MLSIGVYYSFGIFFKPVSMELGWTRAMTSGAFSLAVILSGVTAIPVGSLTDRFGPRTVMTAFGFTLGLGYILMSQVSAIWQLYIFYGVIIGIGMGAPGVSQMSSVTRWFVKRRGLMTGVITTGVGLGAIVVPPLATRLISNYDWRTAYLAMGAVVLVLLVLAAQFMRLNPEQMGQRPYGELASKKALSPVGNGPDSFRKVVKTKQLWISCLVYLCAGFCLFVVMVHAVPHATDLGVSELNAANIIVVIGALSIVGKLAVGYMVDRFGSRLALMASFAIVAASFFWLVAAKDLGDLLIFAGVFGFAYGGMLVPQPTLVAELFGLSLHGLILGISTFSLCIGSALGPLMAGYIFDSSGSYHVAFWISAALAITGLVLTAFLRPVKG